MRNVHGIGIVLLDPLVTMWIGAQHGPKPKPLIFEAVPDAQARHADEWASWRRARARAGL